MTTTNQSDTRPRVQLIGKDGNAFAVIAACSKAAKRAGWDKARVDALLREMMAGDYSHLLSVACTHFKVT